MYLSALLPLALLGGPVHEIRTGDAPQYSTTGLRVAVGDTVRWDATERHPLTFDGESGGPYASGAHERTLTELGRLAFYCVVHGAPGGSGMSGLVTVGDANAPPAITIERETAEPRDGQLVVFSALAADPERIPPRVTWDLDGDGRFEPHLSGVSAGARYGPGTHTVLARATDDLGLIADSRLAFTVPAATATAPAAEAPAPPPVTPRGVTAPVLRVRADRTIRLATLRRRGLRVVVTSGTAGRVTAELRDTRGRRFARVTATVRDGAPVTLRLRSPRMPAGRARLLVRTADGRSISRALTVRR
ncbi:hypothetical protein OJ998_26010 [Solirubrobacter taibaiensis]|nr:hypothetical protein [Solirubrobacter taibaiensis]